MYKKKKGLLIVNLGTPDSYSRSDVAKYLRQFLMDGRVIDIPVLQRSLLVKGIIVPFRSGKSSKAYEELWTERGSPLKVYGEGLVDQIRSILNAEKWSVELAMRYQNPSIKIALNRLMDDEIAELIVFPLFPQYASATTGSVFQEVMKVMAPMQNFTSIRFINQYYDNKEMINLFVNNAQPFLTKNLYDHILFSFHGLPRRQLDRASIKGYCKSDYSCCGKIVDRNHLCYSAQCYETSRAIARALDLKEKEYTICFQSRLGKDEWIKPYTEEVVKNLAKQGKKKVLVFCPAFVADCLETTIEIADEYKELFVESGGEVFDLVPSLNDKTEWARAIVNMVNT